MKISESRTAAPIRNSRIRISQGTLFWREVGSGSPLLMLHGSWQDSSQWVPLMERLGHQFHCLAPDLLGFGESSRLPQRSYSIAAEVAALEEFLGKLRITPKILIADTLGAWVAIRYGLQNPDQLQGLVLMAPEGLSHPELDQRWRHFAWLSYPWALRFWGIQSLAPVIRVLGGDRWLQQRQQRRRQLRQHPATCRLLFQRRLTARRAEYLNESLSTWAVPTQVLQPELATRDVHIAHQCWLDLTRHSHLVSLAGPESQVWEAASDSIQTFVQATLQGEIAAGYINPPRRE